MNANSIFKKLGAGTLLTAVLLGGASCGEVGQGTGGITLNTICPGDFEISIVGDGGDDPDEVGAIFANSVYGRATVIATKSLVARTEFGSDTILDRGDDVNINIPASGAAIYVNSVQAINGVSGTESYLAVAPIGGAAEALPTVLFADDNGRLDVDVIFAQDLLLGDGGEAEFNVNFATEQGTGFTNCEFTVSVTVESP